MGYTRAQFRSEIRDRLGWPAADAFISDAEMNTMIDNARAELFDLLVTMHGPDYFAEPSSFVTVAGTAVYTPDFDEREVGRIVRIDCNLGNGWKIPFRKGNIASHCFGPRGRGWTMGTEVTYFLAGAFTSGPQITFDPVPEAVHTVEMWIVEGAVALADDDTDEHRFGHPEYVILDCMIKCREAEEADAQSLVALKTAYQARIERLARPIDIGQPQTITDMRGAREHTGVSEWFRR